MEDDEATLETTPEGFAAFYRRHVAALLRSLERRTGDLALAGDVCAEAFAAALDGAHRFDPARGPAATWLQGLADRELARAERRGAVQDRAQRRLGMAPLHLTDAAATDAFVRDLEEELVAAARFRAGHRRYVLPRPRLRRPVLLGAAALALLAAAVLVAVGSGGDDGQRAVREPPGRAAPPGAASRLLPMQPLATCSGPAVRSVGRIQGFALLGRARHESDGLPFLPSRLPIGTFDPTAPRLAAQASRWSALHVVPTSEVAADGRCGSDDGPGLCLVADEREFRCFAAAEVTAGRALARTALGTVVGIVPDGIDRVTVLAGGPPVGADVVENVYEAQLDDLAGTQVELSFHRPSGDGCRRSVAPALLARVAVLRGAAQPGLLLPAAALDAVRQWDWQLDAIVDRRARFWGGGDEVGFWAVPVVPRGRAACAPATRVCILAVPAAGHPDAQCVLGPFPGRAHWRLAPLLPGHAVIYGVVADGVRAARVTIGRRTAAVDAGDNVVGGVLPFPYRDGARTRVVLIR